MGEDPADSPNQSALPRRRGKDPMHTSNYQWLLVCLGNPGDKYENTRHNVGYMVADEIAERQGKPIHRLKFKALTNVLDISGV